MLPNSLTPIAIPVPIAGKISAIKKLSQDDVNGILMMVPESENNTIYGQSEIASPRLHNDSAQRAISAVSNVKVVTNLEFNRVKT